MKYDEMSIEEFVMYLKYNESNIILDEELGLVFYPCTNAIEEGLDRSMA